MEVHVFIALGSSPMLHETRSTTLDLHTTSSFLLDILDISAAVTNNLGAKIEAWD